MALVLSRKANESIQIGPDIRVTVIRTGKITRLAVVAPREVLVLRAELLNQTKEGAA